MTDQTKPELKTLTLTVHDDYTGLTTKVTKQCLSTDSASEVIAILREMLLAVGYQPETLARYIHNV